MSAVTKEEAKKSLERLDKWLAMPYMELRDKFEFKQEQFLSVPLSQDNVKERIGKIDGKRYENELTWEDIRRDLAVPPSYDNKRDYSYTTPAHTVAEIEVLPFVNSLTKYALQPSWFKTDYYFPRCPKVKGNLMEYYKNLNIGGVLNFNKFGKTIINATAMRDSHIIVKCLMQSHPILYGCLMDIYLNSDGEYIHECLGSYWYEDGLEKYYQIRLGKEWTGGDVMDDYL